MSLSHFVCLLGSLIFFPLVFNLLSFPRHTVPSGVAVKTFPVVTLGNISRGFIQGLGKMHANACALNIRLCPNQDTQSFSFSFYCGSVSCLWYYLNMQANVMQIAESKPKPVPGNSLQPDVSRLDILLNQIVRLLIGALMSCMCPLHPFDIYLIVRL